MPISVYVDVLLVVNFIINYILLRACTFITGRAFVWWRIYLSAAIGAASAMIIFLPSTNTVSMGLYKLFVTVIMIMTAFGFKGIMAWIVDVIVLFGVSFIFSGGMMALYLLTSIDSLFMYNGVVYFDITAISLVIFMVIGYGVSIVMGRVLQGKNPKEQICTVTIVANGSMISLRGLIDTGNSLTEPFSGLPVIVVWEKMLGKALPEGVKSTVPYMQTTTNIRLIPFASIGGAGVLTGFKPDLVRVHIGDEQKITKDVYIGVSRENIGNSQYDAIVHPMLLHL